METVVITRPMQWAAIPDISEAESLTQADKDCLREVRDVLSRFGCLDRFGLTLIHKHFDIAPDEILVETIDVENRTLTVQPVRREVMSTAIETQWQLADGQALLVCNKWCDPPGGHCPKHEVKW
jgi:hypothetical protein